MKSGGLGTGLWQFRFAFRKQPLHGFAYLGVVHLAEGSA